MQEQIEKYIGLWGLSCAELIVSTKSSTLYKVRYDDHHAVLKVFTALGKQFESQSMRFLHGAQGRGSIKILQSSADALLLEHASSAKLSDLVKAGENKEATHIICDTLDQLHSETNRWNGLANLEEHFKSLFERAKHHGAGPVFKRAAAIATELITSEQNKFVLHGDVHHTNILKSADRGWLAIDPQPLFGERTYDVANTFFNPDDCPEIVESADRMLEMAEIYSQRLKVDRMRILKFAYAHGGLSMSWQLDCHDNPARRMRITKILDKVI